MSDSASTDLGIINLSDESMKVDVRGCGRCGVITVITFNGKGIDNSKIHDAWHEKNPGARQ
jgi:hypothetical protein